MKSKEYNSISAGNVETKRETVAAVLVTYRREKLLMAGLGSILRQSHPPDEVIVIDNSPTAEGEQKAKARFPQVTYRRLGENKGPAGGFAEGIQIAFEHGHDWFWLFDDDCIPKRLDCLEALLAYSREHPEADMVRPMNEDFSNGNMGKAGTWTGTLFKRKVIAKVGFPRADLFFGSEDREYGSRCMRQGFSLFTCRDVITLHKSSRKRTLRDLIRKGYDEPAWRLYYEVRNKCWIDIRENPLTGFFNSLYITARIVFSCAFFGTSRIAQIVMTLRGFVDGLIGRLGRRVEPVNTRSTMFRYRTGSGTAG